MQTLKWADWSRTANAINSRVNHDVEYCSDMAQYGKVEDWEYPSSGRGDCEDYALAKWKALIEVGMARECADIAIAVIEGEGHAVLVLHTDDGDQVLDSNTDFIHHIHSAGLQFIEMSSGGSLLHWVRI